MPGLTKKILLPRTGHWVQQECPVEVPGLMLDFLPQTIS
jgi:epoxide hydrolase A/B